MQIRGVHVALFLAVLVAAAALSNPSPVQHRTKIAQVIAERSPLSAILHLGDLTAFVSNYHSVGVASYTTRDEKLLTLGAFGFVYVVEPSKD
jgi:hypothetical protein